MGKTHLPEITLINEVLDIHGGLGRIRKKWRQKHYTQIQSLLLGGMDLTIASITFEASPFLKNPLKNNKGSGYVVEITNTCLPDDLFLIYAT